MSQYEKAMEAKLSLPLIYRTMVLIYVNRDRIKREPHIKRLQETNASGRVIRNGRGYRRAGGRTSMTERYLMPWELAWLTFQARAEEFYTMLYKYRLKEAANPIFTFHKGKSKGTDVATRMFFKNKTYISTVTQVLGFMLSKKMDKQVEVMAGGEVYIDGERKAYVLYANETFQDFNGVLAEITSKV